MRHRVLNIEKQEAAIMATTTVPNPFQNEDGEMPTGTLKRGNLEGISMASLVGALRRQLLVESLCVDDNVDVQTDTDFRASLDGRPVMVHVCDPIVYLSGWVLVEIVPPIPERPYSMQGRSRVFTFVDIAVDTVCVWPGFAYVDWSDDYTRECLYAVYLLFGERSPA